MNYLKTLIVSAQIFSQLLTISHLAWAPTWRKPNLHKLMTSAENQELLFTLLLSARARWMTWRLNFVRSKDAQKQLARTSLTMMLLREVINVIVSGE